MVIKKDNVGKMLRRHSSENVLVQKHLLADYIGYSLIYRHVGIMPLRIMIGQKNLALFLNFDVF